MNFQPIHEPTYTGTLNDGMARGFDLRVGYGNLKT